MRQLLTGLVDYAGLFPPAALPMSEAVANYARYRTSAARPMLARFVVPAARLNEFASSATTVRAATDIMPWPLAVLAAASDAETLTAFDAAQAGRFVVDSVEAKADSSAGIAALAAAYRPQRAVYVELPVDADPEPLIRQLAERGLRAKIRTGGVTPDAFPSPEQVMRFLAACVRHGVPFKATAGLHHPLRGEYPLTYAADAVRGTMYGYLNIFLAAALLHAGNDPATVLPLLQERDPSAFIATESALMWRGLTLDAEQIAAAREVFAGSFGSCSFDEPVQDLDALSLLPFSR
ncbi:MAG: hypothetical protein KF709_05380 [Gemmatimonadaceae bacterium]|nr:hypothetical protein [Gemmatimonadaceae bacterium]